MGKRHSPARWAAGTFAAAMSLGVYAGVNTARGDQAQDVRSLHKAQSVVMEKDGIIEEAQRNLVRVEQGLGEACLNLVEIYMPGGKLNPSSERTV